VCQRPLKTVTEAVVTGHPTRSLPYPPPTPLLRSTRRLTTTARKLSTAHKQSHTVHKQNAPNAVQDGCVPGRLSTYGQLQQHLAPRSTGYAEGEEGMRAQEHNTGHREPIPQQRQGRLLSAQVDARQ
jgi:hypothetical protein